MTATPSRSKHSSLGAALPKLRTSCDSCGVSKVKCDRGQPECARCTLLGQACVYGPSRKCGKPARKRLATDTDSINTPPYQKRKLWPAETYDNDRTASDGQRHGDAPPQQELPAFANDMASLPSSISTTDFDNQDDLNLAYFPLPPLDEWPSFDGLGTGIDILSIPKNNALGNQTPSSTLEPSHVATAESINPESHSCPRESYEIFRDLICPGPDLHAPETNSDTVCAQLDFVLHFIKNAVTRLTRLLKCSCARSGHRVMVHASIISRILIWYQQAAGWTVSSNSGRIPPASAISISSTEESSSPLSPSPVDDSSDTAMAPTLAQSTGFVVAHVPVSIGTFSIEDQNVQTAVRNQLVLSELKKTADLIDLFVSQNLSESSANGLAGLYSHLGAWLRSEHAKTATVLRARLRAMSENLYF